MEDVLDLYEAPSDPQRPVVCFDELPYQIVAETRCPVPAQPGRPARVDYEYRRDGTANVFLRFDPARGWRRVHVTDRRTKRDFAYEMQARVDEDYPQAERIRLVSDNLNTHTPAALYETFPPAEARRIARKLEFHYTPKHGSWLDMAEIELSVLSGQCLDRRMAIGRRSNAQAPPGRRTAIASTPPSSGASPVATPAPSCITFTQHCHSGRVLAHLLLFPADLQPRTQRDRAGLPRHQALRPARARLHAAARVDSGRRGGVHSLRGEALGSIFRPPAASSLGDATGLRRLAAGD
jgi:hypothetical protein